MGKKSQSYALWRGATLLQTQNHCPLLGFSFPETEQVSNAPPVHLSLNFIPNCV